MEYLLVLIIYLVSFPTHAESGECDHILELAIDAALDDQTAQYNLAVEHWRGECVPKDLSKSRILWRASLSPNSPSSYNNLGYLLYYGFGGPEDHEEAVSLWEQGVKYGSLESLIHLAHAYLDEVFLDYDASEALVLASAALECANRTSSQDHKEMAEEALSKISSVPNAEQQQRISTLADACEQNDA